MHVKYFAWIKDKIGSEKEILDHNNINNINSLKIYLNNKYPDLKKYIDKGIIRFAVNQEYVSTNIQLKEEDEIAIFPPVSGG